MFEMANGSVVQGGWQNDQVAEALDLCLSCKGCKRDCPVGVDMAAYKTEFLAQRYHRRVRPTSHYAMGALPRWLHAVVSSADATACTHHLDLRPLVAVGPAPK